MKTQHGVMLAALAIAGAMFAAPAIADDGVEYRSPHAICSTYSEMAEIMVNARHAGYRQRDVADLLEEGGQGYDNWLLREAYALPDWQSTERQAKAAVDFGNEIYGRCMRQLDD